MVVATIQFAFTCNMLFWQPALVSIGAYFEFFLISNNSYIDGDRIDVRPSGDNN